MTLVSAIALVVAWIATYVYLARRPWPFPSVYPLSLTSARWLGTEQQTVRLTWSDGVTVETPAASTWPVRYGRDFRRVWPARAIVASLVGLAASYLIG